MSQRTRLDIVSDQYRAAVGVVNTIDNDLYDLLHFKFVPLIQEVVTLIDYNAVMKLLLSYPDSFARDTVKYKLQQVKKKLCL